MTLDSLPYLTYHYHLNNWTNNIGIIMLFGYIFGQIIFEDGTIYTPLYNAGMLR